MRLRVPAKEIPKGFNSRLGFCFWPAAAIYNRSSFRHKQEISDKRPVQSIRLGQMVQLPSDKCLDIIV